MMDYIFKSGQEKELDGFGWPCNKQKTGIVSSLRHFMFKLPVVDNIIHSYWMSEA